jgi:hypothetical protein
VRAFVVEHAPERAQQLALRIELVQLHPEDG